jgi:effector-binding domain-containing protein
LTVEADQVRVVTVAAQAIAAVRSRTTMPDLAKAIRAGLDQVWPQIVDRSGRNVVMYHPSEPKGLGRVFEIETGVEVPDNFRSVAPVYVTHTPAGRAVTAAHFGPYEKLMAAYKAIDAYVAGEGLRLAGPSWELYGHWSDEPQKLRTDIFFPLA